MKASVSIVLSASLMLMSVSARAADDPVAKAVESETRLLVEDFMKGFRSADTDNDQKVAFAEIVQTLQMMGIGAPAQATAARSGRPQRPGQEQAAEGGRGGRRGGAAGQRGARGGRGRRGAQGNVASGPEARFASRDTDGNGTLTGDEVSAILRDTPEFKDDAIVTLDEYKHIWEEMFGSQGGGQQGGGSHRGGRRRGGSVPGQAAGGRYGGIQSTDIEFLAMLDANKDGDVTPEEISQAIRQDLTRGAEARSKLDTDGDGKLSTHEYSLSIPRREGQPVGEDGLDGHGRGHFRREDYDGDGFISAQEIVQRVASQASGRVRTMQLCLRLAAMSKTTAAGAGRAEAIATALSASTNPAVRSILQTAEGSSFSLKSVYNRIRTASEPQTDRLDKSI